MKKTIISVFLLLILQSVTYAQDELINKIKDNQSNKSNFQFTLIKQLDNTTVKNQGSSGTCWSYAGNSFLESEIYKNIIE